MTPVAPADTAAPASAVTSPAAPATETHAELTEDFQIPTSGPERHEWQMGRLPKKADSAPATNKDDDTSSATEETVDTDDSAPSKPADTTAADSASAQPQKRGKTQEDSDRRWKELSEKAGNLQRENEELKRKLAPPPAAVEKPASQPAVQAEPEPKIDDQGADGKPKYKTLEEFLSAVRKYDREQILKEVDGRTTKAQQERQQADQKQVIAKVWGDRVGKAREKHTDFDAVALNPDLPIKEGSVADAFILDSEHGTEVLYHLGKNPGELERISKLNPLAQARELFKIEQTFAAPPAPARKPTRAPAPPHEVAGAGTVPPDETEQALEDDDFEAFKEAENRKAIAARKGK